MGNLEHRHIMVLMLVFNIANHPIPQADWIHLMHQVFDVAKYLLRFI